jgi:type II secretion system protein N
VDLFLVRRKALRLIARLGEWLAREEVAILLTALVGVGLLVLGTLELVWPTRPRPLKPRSPASRLAERAEPEAPSGAGVWLRQRRLLRAGGWSLVWMLSFWTFLLIGFPTETAKVWLAERLGQGSDTKVSFEGLHIRWNLGVGLTGISVRSRVSESDPAPEGRGIGDGFTMRLDSLNVEPRLSSLIAGKPDIDFSGHTSTGGQLSGSYTSGRVSFSFSDISFKDITMAALPFPSTATMRGSGSLKIGTKNGSIDTEIDGIPGGRRRLQIPGGTDPGLDGKLKISVSLPRFN